MKIEPQNLGSAGQVAARTQDVADIGLAGSKSGSQAASGDGTDQVELSGVSRVIQSAQAQRSGHVKDLTALVRNGRYVPDTALTSRAIVGEALQSRAHG